MKISEKMGAVANIATALSRVVMSKVVDFETEQPLESQSQFQVTITRAVHSGKSDGNDYGDPQMIDATLEAFAEAITLINDDECSSVLVHMKNGPVIDDPNKGTVTITVTIKK